MLPLKDFRSQAKGLMNINPPRTQKKIRSTLFGRKDLLEVYRRAKDFIIRYKLLRMCRFSEENGLKRLTICNLWRIERKTDGALRTFKFDLCTGEWLEAADLDRWPDIPFSPIERTRSLDWGFWLCKSALCEALHAAGADDLPEKGENGVSPSIVYGVIYTKYFGEEVWNRRKRKYHRRQGLLTNASTDSGARALRAVWWDHFVDREVLSALFVIDWRNKWTVAGYLTYARHRPALLKVAAEHRNLLPVLKDISPQQWGRDDLFSRKLWAREGRKSTALDRRPVRPECCRRGRIHSFESAAPWRWLSKASSLIVREWAAVKNNAVIENLALANCAGIHAPVCAYVNIIRYSNAARLSSPALSPLVRRLYRVFLKHCARIWKDRGFAAVRQWLRNNNESDLTLMADYLHAEGFAQGLPDKNSSWPSLLRRSEDWHGRAAIQCLEQDKLLEWDSFLPETVIDGVVCTPLTNTQALALEGHMMSHCVGTYDDDCQRGTYQVFALKESDGVRSTLGIRLSGKDGVDLDQHRGPHNSAVSRKSAAVAGKLLAAYRRALTETLQSGKREKVAEISCNDT